jgi:predicted Rossmann fold flavoprotein
MAAIFAAKGGAETTLLERTRDGGRKILISGGGRCNILPMEVDESRFVTDSSPNTLRKMLRSWPLREQIPFFEHELGIPLAEEPESLKLFPRSNKARDVRDGLLEYARRCGASVRLDTLVNGMRRVNGEWQVDVANSDSLNCDAVIVATGGLSVPNTGSEGFGLRELHRLGHTIHPSYAALTPVTANSSPFAELSGVSLRVTITARDNVNGRVAISTGGFLFTHQGYSGPSVLDVSHVIVRSRIESDASAKLAVQWTDLTGSDWEVALQPQGSRTVLGVVRTNLPDRLAYVLIKLANVDPSRSLAELKKDERARLLAVLTECELPWSGDEGYKKAEVTGGGVSLAEVDPRTMQSKKHPGLYICGEVLDAFGPVGGYNFLWAWATGRSAGTAAALES